MIIGAYRIETLYQEIATALKGLAMTWWWEPGCADSEQNDKVKFEVSAAVLVELTTLETIDAELGP